jgi:hypothetical protein
MLLSKVLKNKNIPTPNTHPENTISETEKYNLRNTNANEVVPMIDKLESSQPSPLIPNAYDVCVGLLDGKTPEELQKITGEMRHTSSDLVLQRDKSSLNPHWNSNPNEERRLIALELYPFLTLNQINTHDCLNELGNVKSCFQSPSLMIDKIKNGTNLIKNNLDANLKKRHFSNDAVAVLNLREGFQNYAPALVNNYPANIDNINRNIINDMCTHCKVGICFNGYCGKDNNFFI